MTYADVKDLVESFGLPSVYYQFEGETGLAPPFLCWYFGGSDDFFADDCNYQETPTLHLELYTDQRDFALEGAIEAELQKRKIPYYKEPTYIKDQRLYMTSYETDFYLTKEG